MIEEFLKSDKYTTFHTYNVRYEKLLYSNELKPLYASLCLPKNWNYGLDFIGNTVLYPKLLVKEITLKGKLANLKDLLFFEGLFTIIKTNYKNVIVAHGTILEEETNQILFMVGTTATKINKTEKERNYIKYNTDKFKENVVYYVSDKLLRDSNYKSLYTKLLKDIILPSINFGIKVVYTSSEEIENTFYQTNVEYEKRNLEILKNQMKEALLGGFID